MFYFHTQLLSVQAPETPCEQDREESENGQVGNADLNPELPYVYLPVHWSGQVRSSQVRSGQVRSGQVRSGQVRSGQVRSGHVRSGHVRSGHVRSGQFRPGHDDKYQDEVRLMSREDQDHFVAKM